MTVTKEVYALELTATATGGRVVLLATEIEEAQCDDALVGWEEMDKLKYSWLMRYCLNRPALYRVPESL